MAQIELRHCTVKVKDGLAGTAVGPTTPPVATDTTIAMLTSVALNTKVATLIPIGARFTIAGETTSTVHVVTGRTPTTMGPTTDITFSPALGAGTYAANAVLTFQSQEISVKIGNGNLTYSETKNYDYVLDRGDLDTVRELDEAPMALTIDAVYEFITTGTSEDVTFVDAIKGIGGAAEWVSSSSDPCEPYAVDIEILDVPPCGVTETENTLFPDFRRDSLDMDLSKATISLKGKCNASEPVVTRVAA